MRNLARRIFALEANTGGLDGPSSWVRIIGKTEAEARAAYEAENGPIPADAGIIFRRIVSPGE
jgi:hypothetical protein